MPYLLIPVADALPAVQSVLQRYGETNALSADEERELSAVLERCVRLSELLIQLAKRVSEKPKGDRAPQRARHRLALRADTRLRAAGPQLSTTRTSNTTTHTSHR